MNDEELRDYLKRFCFGREHLICSRDLVRQKNLRESDPVSYTHLTLPTNSLV